MSDKTNPHAIDVESADYMHTSYEKDPRLKQEPKFGCWTDINDVRPYWGDVIVFMPKAYTKISVETYYTNGRFSQGWNKGEGQYEVSHWMPLPENPD